MSTGVTKRHAVHGQHQAAGGVEHVTVVDLAGVAEWEGIEQVIIVVGGREGGSIEQVGNTEQVARPHLVVVWVCPPGSESGRPRQGGLAHRGSTGLRPSAEDG